MPTNSQPQYASATLINGIWVARLSAKGYNQQLTRISITGQVGAIFSLYLDIVNGSNLLDTTNRGDLNTNPYSPPEFVQAGHSLLGVWSNGTGTMTCYLQKA